MSKTSVYKTNASSTFAAPGVSLLTRRQISLSEAGLASVDGARQVITTISSRKKVTTLVLSHNNLGNDGCVHLFEYLCSPDGLKYGLVEINLVHNNIGDRGLSAIGSYLKGNATLKELRLQGNVFDGDPKIILSFVEALNTSQLQMLAFSTNRGDGDSLISHLLDTLDSPTLRDLQFSMTGLTHASIPSIVGYIISPKCRVHILKASGNQLGIRGVRAIVNAVDQGNYSLLKLDLFANALVDNDDEVGEEEAHLEPGAWQECENRLKKLLYRNERLKRATEKDAFTLLRHARAVLLQPSQRITYEHDSPTAPVPVFPIELQLHILSFLAPTLSPAQCIRVFNYASAPSTLPRLLPSLNGPGCIPDPSSLTFGAGSGGFGMGMGTMGFIESKTGGGGSCANGKCLGAGNSVLCRRESERLRWLTAVGCSVYEP